MEMSNSFESTLVTIKAAADATVDRARLVNGEGVNIPEVAWSTIRLKVIAAAQRWRGSCHLTIRSCTARAFVWLGVHK